MSEQEMRSEEEVHADVGQTSEADSAAAAQSADDGIVRDPTAPNLESPDATQESASQQESGSEEQAGAAQASDASETDLTPIIEALIFAAEDALTEKQIVSIVRDTVGTSVSAAQIARSVEALNESYDAAGRAFRIHVWGGGYRMATTPDFAPFVKTLYYQQKVTKLSRSLLETLAILAYKQPATKPELDYVRGVDCDHALRRLLEMGLVEIAGRADTVGRPLLYHTTPEFMDKFGLSSIDDLPTLREIEELMEDPTYSKEHARLLFREGLGLEGEPDASETETSESANSGNANSDSANSDNETSDSGTSGSGPSGSTSSEGASADGASPDVTRIGVDIEGDGAVGSTDGYVLGGGPDPTQPE